MKIINQNWNSDRNTDCMLPKLLRTRIWSSLRELEHGDKKESSTCRARLAGTKLQAIYQEENLAMKYDEFLDELVDDGVITNYPSELLDWAEMEEDCITTKKEIINLIYILLAEPTQTITEQMALSRALDTCALALANAEFKIIH